MSPPRSIVWKSFTKIDNFTAACKICFKYFRTSGNTSNLAKHLKQHRTSTGVDGPSTDKEKNENPEEEAITNIRSTPSTSK